MSVLVFRWTVKDVSVVTVLAALCVAGNYALVGLPNIKVMDLVVFVSGFVFSMSVGVAVGGLAWIVYGAINPFGFSLPVWLSTILGETMFGMAGGVLGRINYKGPGEKFDVVRFSFEMGLWGLILTVIYDLFTNIVFAITFGVPIAAAIATGWLFPPWFGILHEAGNFILFSSAVYPLIRIIGSVRR